MKSVPRYTSYPTAPHFHSKVGEAEYINWLHDVKPEQPLSLYVHIPFCQKLCWFCGCHTRVVNNYDPIAQYLQRLKQEVALLAPHLQQASVQHIHFGGGSPTALRADDFLNFMEHVKQHFRFQPNCDVAIEIDPRTVDAHKMASYAASGMTRASIGVQSFDDKVQRAINRVQSYDLVRDVVQQCRTLGMNNLNMDLIYGLPYQTLDSIKDTIEQTITLAPDRLSLFGYAHVPWMKKHQELIPAEALPHRDERRAMYALASEILLNAGYVAIGLDHFALPTDELSQAHDEHRLQRNFQGYTTDTAQALIGLGISSISSLPMGYAQNSADVISYAQEIEQGKLPICKGIALSTEDKVRRQIIMDLMCYLEVQVSEKDYPLELQKLAPYLKSKEVSYKKGVLRIEEAGRIHMRLIASVFDCYLQQSSARYSQAV